MSRARPVELVLGSVQSGPSHSVIRSMDNPARAASVSLVQHAIETGVTEFDTTHAHDDSQERLGQLLARKPVRTITKLSPLAELTSSATREQVRTAVDRSVLDSMAALKRGRLDCVVLDGAEQLTAFDRTVWERLIELLEDGTLLALGVSVETPAEALAALDIRDVRHLELPFNVLDWRWQEAGVIDRIRARAHITVHAHSAFLRGLLIGCDPATWPPIPGLDAAETLALIDAFAAEFGRESVADLCLAYVRGQDWIDGVVVGMETDHELDANLRLFVRPPLNPQACQDVAAYLPRVPEQLLNPALWPKGQ